MKILNPTHFCCSSRLLLKFYKHIKASIESKNKVLAKAVDWALNAKELQLKKTAAVNNKMYDLTVLGPLKKAVMGSSVKHIIVGGDYISETVLDFIRIC